MALSDLVANDAAKLADQTEQIARNAEQVERRQCPTHGEYTAHGRQPSGLRRVIWSACPGCAADRDAAEAARTAAERAARIAAELARSLQVSGMPRRFHGRDFASYVTSMPEQAAALTICRDYSEQFDRALTSGGSLILSGRPGTGKSHLAAAVMHVVMAAGRSAQYVTCMDMIRAVRATWRRDSDLTEEQVLRQLGESVDLLVIDEIGVQYGTEGEQNTMFDVLDRRYREMRPVILLTNADRAGFRDAVGERVFDRLREVAQWIPFAWDSHRPAMRSAFQTDSGGAA